MRWLAGMALALFCAPDLGVAAQSRGELGSALSTSVLAQARQCRKLCPADRNPCDPIIFKITDGRCKVRRN